MKKYLLSLFVGFVGFISFCSAVEYLSVDGGDFNIYHLTSNSYSTIYEFPSNYQFMLYNFVDGGGSNKIGGYCGASSNNCEFLPTSIVNSFQADNYTSIFNNYITLSGSCRSSCRFTVYQNMSVDILLYNPSGGSCPECPTCPDVNTGEILSGYILESEIDSGYCISNDLCPVFSGNNFSELIINDIVHESAPLINISIPQEYSRDYSVDENEFTLDISGYNVDYEYIDGIIKTQNSKPTVEDFNKIISELLPLFVPGLVIILFLIFVFRFVKKVF